MLKTATNKTKYNKKVSHIVQSWTWGEFREKLGLPFLRFEDQNLAFQLTLHKIPFTKKYFGYLPKGPFPNSDLAEALVEIGQKNNCVAIKVEPNILKQEATSNKLQADKRFQPSLKSLFTKFNFIIDLTKSEEEILKKMHPKTRYNLKVALKHGVVVEERTDDEAFQIYLDLYFATTKRQNYHGHSPHYHKVAWETLKKAGMARILIAFYQPPTSDIRLPLTAWMLYNFKETLYYPYGGSLAEYKSVMAPTLLAFAAIKLGKKMGLKKFDLWGALAPGTDQNHPWQGFHKFKEHLGGELVEYLGSFDIVFNPLLYHLFNLVEKFEGLKFFLLKILKK